MKARKYINELIEAEQSYLSDYDGKQPQNHKDRLNDLIQAKNELDKVITLPSEKELAKQISEKVSFVDSGWNVSEDYLLALRKGYRGCIEWLKTR